MDAKPKPRNNRKPRPLPARAVSRTTRQTVKTPVYEFSSLVFANRGPSLEVNQMLRRGGRKRQVIMGTAGCDDENEDPEWTVWDWG
jgi:hypothetical protein